MRVSLSPQDTMLGSSAAPGGPSSSPGHPVLARGGEHIPDEVGDGGVAGDAALAALWSSSVPYSNSMVPLPAHPCSTDRPRFREDLDTGEIVAQRCGRNGCPYCLPKNGWVRAVTLAATKPQRVFRISRVADEDSADPWQCARDRIKKTRRNLKRLGFEPGYWSYTVEHNPKGTGYHAHGLQRGPSIPNRHDRQLFSLASQRAGAGWAWIKSIRQWAAEHPSLVGDPAEYQLKAAIYQMKDSASQILALNGGAVEHHTPGFMVIEGVDLSSDIRAAQRAALRLHFPSDTHRFAYFQIENGRRRSFAPVVEKKSTEKSTVVRRQSIWDNL
jgi:hypothetical protein